jgi:hypothetical protein
MRCLRSYILLLASLLLLVVLLLQALLIHLGIHAVPVFLLVSVYCCWRPFCCLHHGYCVAHPINTIISAAISVSTFIGVPHG